jgi:glycosyltransferase involved in cell wall biosynthesis
MIEALRVALVGPVATTIPARKSGSVELITQLLADGLSARGHVVTLFGVAESRTSASLHATFERGYVDDPHGMWPWEMGELLNVAAACERHAAFDLIHYQGAYFPMSLAFSRLLPVPIVQTLHHQPHPSQLRLLQHYPEAHYVAISDHQAQALNGLRDVTVIPHGLDIDSFPFGETPDDYLVFLGRFIPGKGALEAIEVARRSGARLLMAAAETEYYKQHVAQHVDGEQVQYLGELDFAAKTALLALARALIYPVQAPEPFGLVLVEAMACGTPVAALRCGAVPELIADGVSGHIFDTLDELAHGLPRVYTLDRTRVRAQARQHFDVSRMLDAHEALYQRLVKR